MSSEERAAKRAEAQAARWAAMTPEQREKRERWNSMTPEERHTLKEEKRAQWANLTPEEREKRKANRRQERIAHRNAEQ